MSGELEIQQSFINALTSLIEELNNQGKESKTENQKYLGQLQEFLRLVRETESFMSKKNIQEVISVPATGKRTIYVYAKVLSLGEIDTINENFKAEVHVKSCWREPLLDGTAYRRHIAYQDWLEYWKPELYLENGFPDAKESTTYVLKYDAKGRALVEEKRVVKGTFAEVLELYDFPFDVQELTVRLGSAHSCDELCIEINPSILSSMSGDGFRDRQQWQVFELVQVKPTYDKSPSLSITCKVKRLTVYFWINVISIMFFIGLLTFCTFTINSKKVESRLNTSFFLILALVTYRFGVNKMLPKISYLTYLDKYMLANFSFICIVPIWHAIVAQVDDSQQVEYMAMAIIATLYLIFNIAFVVISRLAEKKRELKNSAKNM